MSRVYNLDPVLADEAAKVTLGGKEYPVAPVSTRSFLHVIKAMQELEAAKDQEESLAKIIALIKRLVPDLPEEALWETPFGQVLGLLEFITQELRNDPNVQRAMVKAPVK